ncbi:MAG: condensation domain-containing protein [Bacteroidota bacterium]
MVTKGNVKIEAIYPLSSLQQGILLHHLSSEKDQGLLYVQCGILGEVNLQILKQSWAHIVKRHDTLRTSVHWKKMEQPVKIVRPDVEMDWSVLDWTSIDKTRLPLKLKDLKDEDEITGIDFEKRPLSKIRLIQTEKGGFILLWRCHHLLLDGWSASIVLKDVFTVYDALYGARKWHLETVPSLRSYLNWLKVERVEEQSETFWKSNLINYSAPKLFDSKNHGNGEHVSIKMVLDERTSEQLRHLAREYRITNGNLFQGIWGLSMARYFNTLDVIAGLTVSGRSKPFPKIELMTGMFTNVLPLRFKISSEETIQNWFKAIQEQLSEVQKFEDSQSEQITDWIQWKSPQPLYDNLLVYENFPLQDIKSGGLTVQGFQSGVTTTYPITVTVMDRDIFQIELLRDTGAVTEGTVNWFKNAISHCVQALLSKKLVSPIELLETIPAYSGGDEKEVTATSTIDLGNYVAPKNQTQLKLVEIWESYLNTSPISIHDNFFELGGKSLVALKIFSKIEKKLGIKINPTVLLEHPTISEIADSIKSNKAVPEWKYTVPLKESGAKTPLFCIHGGGGHVFFFKEMADCISSDRGIYALQPSGIFNEDEVHHSIEDMAHDYAKEIMQIQPTGPYNLLVYCFSTAVGIEMSNYFHKQGHSTNLIVVDSIIDQENFHTSARIASRFSGFFKRMAKNPFSAIQLAFQNQWSRYIEPIQIQLSGSEQDKKLAKITTNLIKIYNRYTWSKKHHAQLYLILTEKDNKFVDLEYRKGWTDISHNPIEVGYTEGHHFTIFEGAAAKALANTIETVLKR